MTIEELEDKHFKVWYDEENDSIDEIYNHTKLSIEFAIEELEELIPVWVGDAKMVYLEDIEYKIQKLKQYLDEQM